MKKYFFLLQTSLLFGFVFIVPSCRAQKDGGKYTSTNSKAIKSYEKALLFYDARDNENALKELQAAVDKDPNFVEAWTMLGYVYSDMKQYDKAIESLQKAIVINPNYYRGTFFTLARLQMMQAKYANAKINYEEYLKSPKKD